MKISQMTVARGETINTGNFNSVRVDVSVTATLDDADDAEATWTKLRETVKSKCATLTAEHRRAER